MTNKTIIKFSLNEIAKNKSSHSKESGWYQSYANYINEKLELARQKPNVFNIIEIEELGEIFFPYYSFGKIDSLNLLNLDELISFSLYAKKINRYKILNDFGANIGLHSIVMGKLKVKVKSVEPDPIHVNKLKELIKVNQTENHTQVYMNAVGPENKDVLFNRIVNNTTGSHIVGTKNNVSGPVDTFKVSMININNFLQNVTFSKLDVEGLEYEILSNIDIKNWPHSEFLIEIGSSENAEMILHLADYLSLKLRSQLSNWELVNNINQVPKHYSDGLILISNTYNNPWI